MQPLFYLWAKGHYLSRVNDLHVPGKVYTVIKLFRTRTTLMKSSLPTTRHGH